MPTPDPRFQLANCIRALSMDAVEAAKSGHVGLPLGMADAATVLFSQFLKFDAANPDWPDRDRFVLSAGHGSMLLYALLHLTGYPGVTMEEIRRFRQLGSKTPGHPEYGHTPGVETTTGPLGQGFANAVGMAIAERHLNARFGDGLVDHRTYVLAGDGCLMEGVSQEALTLAGHLKLSRLIVLFDDNRVTIDGSTDLSDHTDQLTRFIASGWNVTSVDGHDPEAVEEALEAAQTSDKPVLIACRTTIGFGAPKVAGTGAAHGGPYGAEEVAGVRAAIGWPHPPFEIPADLADAWLEIGRRGAGEHAKWRERRARSAARAEFDRAMKGEIPEEALARLAAHTAGLAAAGKADATRKWSGAALEVLTEAVPELIGGSADLTGSNNTKTPATQPLTVARPGGRFIHYGVREHAMAAAMNGMALHGGVIPYSGTFLAFADYSRPAIRLGALMGVRVVHVMTHDSIGLGEDGPTHQPVEHLAALRAIPNLLVFRPCDGVEAAECWAAALAQASTPSVLALTRQSTPAVRTTAPAVNPCLIGGYVISPAEGEEAAALLATGSEVAIAIAAQRMLKERGVAVRVVSLPCLELFERLSADERADVLGRGLPRVAVEAGVRQGWDRYLGPHDRFIGMSGFGASAPYADLYRHFGITAEAVVEAVLGLLDGSSAAREPMT